MGLRISIAIAACLCAAGCVQAAKTTIGAAGAVGKTAAGVTVDATGAALSVGSGKRDDRGHKKKRKHHDDPRPFDASRNAMADVDAALTSSEISGKRVLLVLGGNWCHDSRGLAAKFEQRELAQVIGENYHLVWVDVGRRDRNLDVPARFGVPQLFGTPTVLILSPEETLLNADSVHDWRAADSKPYDETLRYFESFALRDGNQTPA